MSYTENQKKMCQYTLLNLCEFINQITSCEWNSCSLKGVIELHCVCIESTKINLKLTCFYIIISVAVKISSKIACACYCVTAVYEVNIPLVILQTDICNCLVGCDW